jgi:hypothetical protein
MSCLQRMAKRTKRKRPPLKGQSQHQLCLDTGLLLQSAPRLSSRPSLCAGATWATTSLWQKASRALQHSTSCQRMRETTLRTRSVC